MKELEQQHQMEIETTRVGGFGGSDAALFLRIAKKGGVEGLSNTDLYRIAVAMGIKPYVPVPVTEAMQNGHIFEDSYERILKDSGITSYEREVKLVAECQPKNFKIFAHADFLINGKNLRGNFRRKAVFCIRQRPCAGVSPASSAPCPVSKSYYNMHRGRCQFLCAIFVQNK